jgi:uncharacterized membrane protein YfbV (UPF0208 family)
MRAWLIFLILTLLTVLIVAVGYCIHLRLGGESLGMWGTYLTGAGTVLLALAASYAGIQAIKEFRARTRAEKARWTTELFRKFYEEGHGYRLIRQKIDYDDLSDILVLMRKGLEEDFSQEERDRLDKFTDYLNFFEYIAYLLQKGQLDDSDVRAMFEYYLTRMTKLKDAKELGDWIKANGFERLHKLLVQYGLKP